MKSLPHYMACAFAIATSFAFCVCAANSANAQDAAPEGFTSLFDGKSIDNWEQKNGTATYEIKDGTILGTTATGSPNSFLCSKKEYGDFELHFEVKVDDELNSGVQIRSVSKSDYKNGRVHGPQVEIAAASGSGYIYSEGTGRGWISLDRPVQDAFKKGEWNKYRVVADGCRVQTWINGKYVEDVIVPAVEPKSGFIGLQVHGIGKKAGPYSVQWKNIDIKELTVKEERVAKAIQGTPEIDGKVDDVWKNAPRFVTTREVPDHNTLGDGQTPSIASVRCMWDEGHLYCLAEVKDDKISVESFDDWAQDSVEFFVNPNMSKTGSYDDDDAQYRTNANGVNSCGASNSLDNYTAKTTKVEGGYIVEACIKIETAAGKKIGFDVQVNNDPGFGMRGSTAKWSDPTNASWENLASAGVLELVDGQ